jgi:hypothetical protein
VQAILVPQSYCAALTGDMGTSQALIGGWCDAAAAVQVVDDGVAVPKNSA